MKRKANGQVSNEPYALVDMQWLLVSITESVLLKGGSSLFVAVVVRFRVVVVDGQNRL